MLLAVLCLIVAMMARILLSSLSIQQMTFWSRDGKYIYFVSQRGSATGQANVWKLALFIKIFIHILILHFH